MQIPYFQFGMRSVSRTLNIFDKQGETTLWFLFSFLGPVVRRVDNFIQRRNPYPADKMGAFFASAIAQQAVLPHDISTGGSKPSSHRDTQTSAKHSIGMLLTITRRNKKGKYQLERKIMISLPVIFRQQWVPYLTEKTAARPDNNSIARKVVSKTGIENYTVYFDYILNAE